MSVLKKIRENVGLVIVIIALSLFAFIFSSVYNKMGPSQDSTIGEINGNSIDYAALNNKYEMATRSNPNSSDVAAQYQMKEQAWQTLVQEVFYTREWNAAGIGLSKDELMMMYTGQIYSQYVIQSGYFSDSTGRYNPGTVSMVFQRADEIDLNDPNVPDMWRNWKQGLVDMRESISLTRKSNKWQAAIKGSALVSDNELKWGYEDASRTADISYLYIPYASIPDEQLQITDADRRDFYNKHRGAYLREDDEVNIQYAFFGIQPSRRDSADTRQDLSKLIPDFLTSTEPFEFANSSTDGADMDTTPRPLAELPAVLSAVNGRTDTVVGPVRSATGFELLRIVKVVTDSVSSNYDLRHILVRIAGPTAEDSAAAKTKANEIAAEVRGDQTKFEALAAEKSDDAATKGLGGELGWVPQNAFGETFGNDLKNAGIGSVVVTSSPQGYHVVLIDNKSNKLYSYARINRGVIAGTETNDSIFKRASMYYGDVISGNDMETALKAYPEASRLTKSGNIGPGTYNLAGLTGARPVVIWAFKNDEGSVCDKLLETENALVVAKILHKGTKGYANIDELKENFDFETGVRNMVKAKQIKAKLGNGGTDLQAMASSYGVGANVGEASGLRMASSDVQNLGQEPKVVGRAFGLQPGAVSAPLAGNSGVIVVKLKNISEPAAMDDINKMIQRQTLSQAKVERTITALYLGMRELAQVRDMRYKADF